MGRRVYRFALTLVGNSDDAEDVAVQTFAAAFNGRSTFKGTSSVETWLYRIAFHHAQRQLRSKRARRSLNDAIVDPSQSDQLCRVEIDQFLSSLPNGLRSAFVLVKLDGLKYREAAEVLGKRVGTIQRDVHEACKKLREKNSQEAPGFQPIQGEICHEL